MSRLYERLDTTIFVQRPAAPPLDIILGIIEDAERDSMPEIVTKLLIHRHLFTSMHVQLLYSRKQVL